MKGDIMLQFEKKLGKRIQDLRKQTGLSQEYFAKYLGVKRPTVTQIENGKRQVKSREINRIAEIFNTTPGVLLDFEKSVSVVLQKRKSKKSRNKPQLRINVPQKKVDKFKEVLLYVLQKVGSQPNIGQSVIYKLLYFIDFDYYERYEEQIIGATYTKNHYGPTPNEFVKIVKDMEGKDLRRIKDEYFEYPQTKYLPLREADLSRLNATEVKMIDEVLDRLAHRNAREISEYSHGDVPWITADDGDIIEYESVFYRTPPYSVRLYDEENIQ
jgi:transcriptional regulator with XRE-family HTH domain